MTLTTIQLLVIGFWLLASLVAGLLAIGQFYLTGQAQTTLATVALALAGSFGYFLWPRLDDPSPTVAFGMLAALVVGATAVALPLVGPLILKFRRSE